MTTYSSFVPRQSDVTTIPEFRTGWFKPRHLLVALLLAWFIYPLWFRSNDPTSGYIEQTTWLLLVLSMITFLLVAGLCWWLLGHFWSMAGLPEINALILKFNELTTWQQLSLFFASFLALLLGAVTCIGAIC